MGEKLDKLNDQSRKDDVVTFEELGVDRTYPNGRFVVVAKKA